MLLLLNFLDNCRMAFEVDMFGIFLSEIWPDTSAAPFRRT